MITILSWLIVGWMVFRFLGNRNVEITINTAEDADWLIYQKIKDAINNCPRVLNIELIGMGVIHPNVVLAIHDLLFHRNRPISLHVAVRTNICDGTMVFVLLADQLKIRQGAWVQIAKLEEKYENWSLANRSNTIHESGTVRDYRMVMEILNQYVPVKELYNKRVELESLVKDFGLALNQEQEQELLRLSQEKDL
jgi:hypothetical protein